MAFFYVSYLRHPSKHKETIYIPNYILDFQRFDTTI